MKITRTYDDVNPTGYCVKNGEIECNYVDCTDETCLEWTCSIFGELGETDENGNIRPCPECVQACKDAKK